MISSERIKKIGKVAVLMGGPSVEHDISIMSGQHVLSVLQSIGISAQAYLLDENTVEQLKKDKISRVFNAVHGLVGEDGTLQGALDLAKIPYTGSGVLASALGMNKYLSKLVWQANQLNVPACYFLKSENDVNTVEFNKTSRYIVKPVNSGSSFGISVIDSKNQLEQAYKAASNGHHDVIVEQFIEGREYIVVIQDDMILTPIEIFIKDDFFDFQTKYGSPTSEHSGIPKLEQTTENKIKDSAKKAYDSLNCRGITRVDLIQDQNDNIWVIEINTIPGFRAEGAICEAVKFSKISLADFFIKALESTF